MFWQCIESYLNPFHQLVLVQQLVEADRGHNWTELEHHASKWFSGHNSKTKARLNLKFGIERTNMFPLCLIKV